MQRLKQQLTKNKSAKTKVAIALLILATGGTLAADSGSGSLKTVPVPAPADLSSYVRDQNSLVVLGKALFWDMQVGADGKQACASCHFHAGADHRGANQLNPNGGSITANHIFGAADFPAQSQTVVGSAGEFTRTFTDIVPGNSVDAGFSVFDPTFSLGGVSTRRVTGRNTPSVIDAVFNVRNFWDGRANNTFSVFTPFGNSDPNNNIVVQVNGKLQSIKVQLQNASLASQSVGPPNNPTEMASAGRNWEKLGKKMLSLAPLAKQHVDPTDSVLGPYAKANGSGLKSATTYSSLIQAAFYPKYWNSGRLVDVNSNDIGVGTPHNTNEYSQMEYNFAMFWGMAVDAYESTLVAANSRYDQFAEGNKSALTSLESQGMNIFNGKGQCQKCHSGPEFAGATFTAFSKLGPVQKIDAGMTDTGYFRTGVRPIAEDQGIAGNDGFGNPLSVAVQQNPSTAAVKGAFKTPSIRNSEFTGPYFHNGGKSTLEQVIDFYSRGGDFPADGNLGPGIQKLGLSASDQAALVAFIKATSDDRVRYEKAPFDHPQLCVPNGEKMPISGASNGSFNNEAVDNMVEIAAVGAAGGPALQSFAELIGAAPSSGPRAHDMTQACTMHQ
jgi:cytochrome c peroxidase